VAAIKIANAAGANWQTAIGMLLPGSYIIQVVNDRDKKLIGQSMFVKLEGLICAFSIPCKSFLKIVADAV